MIEDVKRESVDHPDHYGGDVAYEAIKIIEAHSLGFHLGNAVKYILRAEKKGGTVDLQKALWYIQREISNREEEPDHVTIERLWREERSG